MLFQGKVLTTVRSLAEGEWVAGCGFLGDFVFTIYHYSVFKEKHAHLLLS